jgi:hypothetical protein
MIHELATKRQFPRLPWEQNGPNGATAHFVATYYDDDVLLWDCGSVRYASTEWAPTVSISGTDYAPDPYEINGMQSFGGGAVFRLPDGSSALSPTFALVTVPGPCPLYAPEAYRDAVYDAHGDVVTTNAEVETEWKGAGWYEFSMVSALGASGGTVTLAAQPRGVLRNQTPAPEPKAVKISWPDLFVGSPESISLVSPDSRFRSGTVVRFGRQVWTVSGGGECPFVKIMETSGRRESGQVYVACAGEADETGVAQTERPVGSRQRSQTGFQSGDAFWYYAGSLPATGRTATLVETRADEETGYLQPTGATATISPIQSNDGRDPELLAAPRKVFAFETPAIL